MKVLTWRNSYVNIGSFLKVAGISISIVCVSYFIFSVIV